MNKLELLKKLIEGMPLYFSYNVIRNGMRKETSITDSTLQTYLSREVSAGHIWSAGKGWYSKLEKEFLLNTEPVQEMIGLMKQKFPFLDCSCWSTEQVNSFTHHMLGKHITFVYVDSDAISTVHEILLDNGYNSYANPYKNVIEKVMRITQNTVLVRPSISLQPDAIDSCAPIEKILVDLMVENSKLSVMQKDELNLVIENILKSGRLNVAVLLFYMKRRKLLTDTKIKELHFLEKVNILDFSS
jgi:uncharacterized protein DUF6577